MYASYGRAGTPRRVRSTWKRFEKKHGHVLTTGHLGKTLHQQDPGFQAALTCDPWVHSSWTTQRSAESCSDAPQVLHYSSCN